MIWLLIYIFIPNVFAEDTLRETEKDYLKTLRKQKSIFESAPVNHINPKFKAVSLALDFRNMDFAFDDSTLQDTTITHTGYEVSPYIALSLKKIGIGVAGEVGRQTIVFDQNFSVGNQYTETSIANYSGMGIYFYLIPVEKKNKYKIHLILGTKLLNVKHEASHDLSGLESEKSIKYTLNRHNVGLNFSFHLSKRLQVIPWGNYLQTSTDQAETEINAEPVTSSTSLGVDNRLLSDLEIMWNPYSPVTYGIDIGYKKGRLELRLGGIIGMLASMNQSVDNRLSTNNSAHLGISFDLN